MAEPVLAATGLRKAFGDVVAVDGVDLEVAQGGSLAIVGESGSGKTTVARMLVGLTAPTAGTITACGRDRSTPSRSAKERRRRGGEVQIVFQDPYSSLDPRHSAEQAIDEVLRLHRSGVEGRAAHAHRGARGPRRPRRAPAPRRGREPGPVSDGTYHHYLSRAVPVRDEAGRVREWIGSSIDITGRKRAEDALRESEHRLDLATRAANEGIWDWDMETGGVVASELYVRNFGGPGKARIIAAGGRSTFIPTTGNGSSRP